MAVIYAELCITAITDHLSREHECPLDGVYTEYFSTEVAKSLESFESTHLATISF
jgi:hypothetical protein